MTSLPSSIAPLQKLNNLLQAGALTRQEYEELKARLPQEQAGEALLSPPREFTQASHTLEEQSGDAGSKGIILPHLEVDHLLGGGAQEEKKEAPGAVFEDQPQPLPAPVPVPTVGASPVKRFEPRPGNVLRFNPLRGREPETRWYEGNMLNYVLLASILALVFFGAYLLVNRNEYGSEQIASIRTDRSGGVASDEPQDRRLVSVVPTQDFEGDLAPVTEEDFQIEQISPDEPLQAGKQEAAQAEAITPEAPIQAVPEESELEEEEPVEAPVPETASRPAQAPPASEANQVPDEPRRESTLSTEAALPADQERKLLVSRTPAESAASDRAARDAEDLVRVENSLQRFYADFQAKPFSAHVHFAPRVERFYTLTNVTPQEIKENIERHHFAEFLEARSSFDPTSLQIVNRDNGGIEVVFVEQGEALRKSLNQRQKITARVRAKFDRDFRMTYYRQERILTSETK